VSHAATTEDIKREEVRNLMVTAIEQRFGLINFAGDDRLADPWFDRKGSLRSGLN
jgi:hypothetical protein